MKKLFSFIFDILKTVIIVLVIVVPIRYFLFQPFIVKGESMEPNFYDGDYLIIDEISYRLKEPQRGETIIFKYPKDPSKCFIKRIIGLPGETIKIQNDQVIILRNSDSQILDESEYLSEFGETFSLGFKEISLAEDEYFVLGDNRKRSSDSRNWGILPEKNIVGRAYLRIWPFSNFRKIKAPEY